MHKDSHAHSPEDHGGHGHVHSLHLHAQGFIDPAIAGTERGIWAPTGESGEQDHHGR